MSAIPDSEVRHLGTVLTGPGAESIAARSDRAVIPSLPRACLHLAENKRVEISVPHQCILFLGDLLEFRHQVLEAMRQPMNDRVATISRVKTTLAFPAGILYVQPLCPDQ